MEKVTETPATSLSLDEITTSPLAPAPVLDALCVNDDPRDPVRSEYDADPHNTQW